MSGSPEEILRGALEKIVFFECRVDQLESELRTARATASRAREEAGEARRREAEAQARLAEAGVQAEALRREIGELTDRTRLLEEERSRFLTGLVEQARVAGATGTEPGEGRDADLAGFIAELRAEIDRLSRWKAAAEGAGIALEDGGGRSLSEAAAPRRPVSLPELAERFAESGRARLGGAEAASLPAAFPTRSERTLYLRSLEELSSGDASVRKRASGCLKALGAGAAVPVLGAALGRERDAGARAAIVEALGGLGERAAAPLLERELGHEQAVVRAAALDALAALLGAEATPALSAGLGDESAAVRRRAAMLLGFAAGDGADEALSSALADADPGVARAAAAALGGRTSTRAQAALARALDHGEAAVRRVAARAVERWSGEQVNPGAEPAERRRVSRRIAERLHALQRSDLRGALVKAATAMAPSRTATQTPTATRIATPTPTATPTSTSTPIPTPVAAAPAARSAVAVAEVEPGLAEAILLEVRAALRGCTEADLAAALGRRGGELAGSLATLVARGELVARGPRYFQR